MLSRRRKRGRPDMRMLGLVALVLAAAPAAASPIIFTYQGEWRGDPGRYLGWRRGLRDHRGGRHGRSRDGSARRRRVLRAACECIHRPGRHWCIRIPLAHAHIREQQRLGRGLWEASGSLQQLLSTGEQFLGHDYLSRSRHRDVAIAPMEQRVLRRHANDRWRAGIREPTNDRHLRRPRRPGALLSTLPVVWSIGVSATPKGPLIERMGSSPGA